MYGVRGGIVQMSIPGCELILALWSGVVALTSGCRFHTQSALTV